MRYLDTSVLVAYLTPEMGSSIAEAFMRSAGEPIAVSTWTEVELRSALALKIRTGQLSEADANGVVDVYDRLISPQLHRIAVTDGDHQKAVALLTDWKSSLRGGDALHLAISVAHGATVFTLDKGMASAGNVLGIPVRLLV